MREYDISVDGGRRVHIYDAGEPGADVVVWQHGAGMRGIPAGPFMEDALALGLRVISLDRPGYGGSEPWPDRSVADGARLVLKVLDRLKIHRAATIGLSAGGMHALGCAALAPNRIVAAATLCGPAPFNAGGPKWWAGMAKANSMEFLAAATSRAALECYLAAVTDVDLSAFAPADIQAMNGPYWDWQLSAIDSSSDEGAIEDVLASVRDWDVDPASVETPVLVIHGREDSFVPVAHAEWIADTCKNTELVLKDGGHISTIPDGAIALPWFASIFSTGG